MRTETIPDLQPGIAVVVSDGLMGALEERYADLRSAIDGTVIGAKVRYLVWVGADRPANATLRPGNNGFVLGFLS